MRLFVALWPPPEVLDEIDRLPRPEVDGVRWTGRDQWHVTLRFLGEVGGDDARGVAEAVAAAASSRPPRLVQLGPATRRYGRGALGVPVSGIDDVAAAVVDATAPFGRPPEHRAFRGHLTVARGTGKAAIPRSLEGIECDAGWTATELAVVRSHLGAGPATYETLSTTPLAG